MSKTKLLQLGVAFSLLLLGIAAIINSPSVAHGATTISTPTNVQVTATGSQSITLSWSTSTDSSGTGMFQRTMSITAPTS